MLVEKYIFKVHRNGQVERIKDCNQLRVSDITAGLGIDSKQMTYRPIQDSGVYAFYGNDQCDILILGVPEKTSQLSETDIIHGFFSNQFKILSTQQPSL